MSDELQRFRVAQKARQQELDAEGRAAVARANRDRHLALVDDLEAAAHRDAGLTPPARPRVVDRRSRLVCFIVGGGAMRTAGRPPRVPAEARDYIATAIREAWGEASVEDWVAEWTETDLGARDTYAELVAALRVQRLSYPQIADWLRDADRKINGGRVGPLLRDYVDDEHQWRAHPSGSGRDLLVGALRQLIRRRRTA